MREAKCFTKDSKVVNCPNGINPTYLGNFIIYTKTFIYTITILPTSFLGGSAVENLAAAQKQVQSLGQEDPLEEGIATHSSILAWRIPWTEEPSGLKSIGSQRVGHNWSNLAHAHAINKTEAYVGRNNLKLELNKWIKIEKNFYQYRKDGRKYQRVKTEVWGVGAELGYGLGTCRSEWFILFNWS